MKNILIPTDFSDNAWNAIKYGTALYHKTRCTFHIIHINPISYNSGGEAAMYVSPELLEETILKESNEKLEHLLKDVERLPLNTKHTFKTTALYGFFTDHIKQEVKDKNIDLIIMGTKGATGLKAVSLGSNTGNVLTKVRCAVLAVPEDAEYTSPREIGFPTDYQLSYEIKVLDQIKELALMHNSALRFLYVAKKGENLNEMQLNNKEFLKNYFRENEHSFYVLTEKKLDDAVQAFVESRDLDMLVMVAKNLNFLERILFKPMVEKISYHTKIPFLIVHE
ncbi:universal stress protein [Arenibacter sp. F26102]|uniref:Universal stress protein n=1 Tax=Arenibacter arenosicollis TaxID=2762274 RepID=A0ABR7QN98_9FLAO|nr:MULTISPECIES: universal stress protein [Arenibacter]MBC8768663.1 universal stress protein [Arenibacter arenosicollis]MCK0146657.1 universal stress protein [Arenibacter sp. F26102]